MRRLALLHAWSRREFLRGLAVGAASATLPSLALGCKGSSVSPAPTFLTNDERAALGRIADYIFPPDAQPGGSALGAAAYVDGLLTALDGDAPTVFRGGPYSGRQPFADTNGNASSNYPSDAFASFLPLDRFQLAAWKLRLFGSSGLPGGGPNDAVLGPTVGMRDQVRASLGEMLKAAGGAAAVSKLDDNAVTQIWKGLDNKDVLVELVLEAVFCAPEYGGNVNQGGWKIAHFAGDSLPLGYSPFDAATGSYVERADAPITKADSAPDPDPMDAATLALLDSLIP